MVGVVRGGESGSREGRRQGKREDSREERRREEREGGREGGGREQEGDGGAGWGTQDAEMCKNKTVSRPQEVFQGLIHCRVTSDCMEVPLPDTTSAFSVWDRCKRCTVKKQLLSAYHHNMSLDVVVFIQWFLVFDMRFF